MDENLSGVEPQQPKAPSGWYPTPDGGQRYWDGDAWTAIPAPEAVATLVAPSAAPKRSLRRPLIIAASVVVVAALVGGGIAFKSSVDAASAAHAAQLAAKEQAAQQAADDAAAAAVQKRKDDAERASRLDTVTGIESSVKKMAAHQAAVGLINGPILDSTCSPVAGGSTDDLTQATTVFSCFVGTKKNSDGTESGYNYHATMNWTTGSYTYGLGAP
jgi:hypothetical protein